MNHGRAAVSGACWAYAASQHLLCLELRQAGQGEALPAVVTTGAAFLQVFAKALEVGRYGTWAGP